MDKTSYDYLLSLPTEQPPATINVIELQSTQPRTLLYGYTCDRDSFHVYIQYGQFHRVVYRDGSSPRFRQIVEQWHCYVGDAQSFIPNKRVYPAASDMNFCRLLIAKGLHIPFTTYDDKQWEKYQSQTFYGLTNEDYFAP